VEYPDIESLLAAVGDHLGYSDWVVIDQNRINGFAAATGDNQWIHVDPELAATGPFGTTIAHGYLTLSMTNQFLPELLQVPLATMGINYGANKIRFPAPVPVDSLIRMGSEVIAAEKVSSGDGTWVQVITRNTVEIQGGEKPACVVEAISRFLFSK
jgi:acyl dehydratase